MTRANAYARPCSDCDPPPPGRMAAGALASIGLVVARSVLLLGGVVRVCRAPRPRRAKRRRGLRGDDQHLVRHAVLADDPAVCGGRHLFEWAEVVVLGWNALEGSHPFFSQRWRPPAGASSSLAARWPVSPAPSWRCACTTVASPSASASPLTCSPARARPWAFRPSPAGWRPRRRARRRTLAASIGPGAKGSRVQGLVPGSAREASHGHQGMLRRPRPNDHLAWHLLGEPWAPCLVAVAPASLRVRISDRSFRPEITSGTIEVASPRYASTSCSAFAALQAPTRGSSPFCTRQLDISYLA